MIGSLPVGDTISAAWYKVKGAKGSIWAALGLLCLIMIAITAIKIFVKSFIPGIHVLVDIIGQVIIFLLQMGLLYLGMQRAFGLPISYRMMFRTFDWPIAIRVIGVYILQIIVFIPVIVLGVLVVLFYSFYNMAWLAFIFSCLVTILAIYITLSLLLSIGFVLDKNKNSWQAIKLSFAATKGHLLSLFVIAILESLIVIISAIPLGIGLIWTLPFVFILYGEIYKRLAGKVLI